MLTNNLGTIDNISLGGFIPNDVHTQALWIFDGSLVDGKIKDWSGNNNHLVVISGVLEFEDSNLGKVLKVNTGLHLVSENEVDLEWTNKNIDMMFKCPAQDLQATKIPNNLNYDISKRREMSTFLTGHGTAYKGGLGIDRYGVLMEYFEQPGGTAYANLEKFRDSDNKRWHRESDTNGENFFSQLNYKTWTCISLNQGIISNHFINGVETELGDANPGGYASSLVSSSKFYLFPRVGFNDTKNVAYVRLSSKQRTSTEVLQMARYFSTASGHFKEVKILDTPQNNFEVKKIQVDGVKPIDYPLSYKIGEQGTLSRASEATSEAAIIGKIYLVESGIARFDYDEYGAAKGLRLEDTKQNLIANAFTHAAQYNSHFDTEWLTFPNTSPTMNHHAGTVPVYGDNYGETNSTAFHYVNYPDALTNSGIYTLSLYMKRTDAVNEHYPSLSIQTTGSSNFNFTDMEIVESSPLYSGYTQTSSALRFQFDKTADYDSWKRLWVSFKLYTDVAAPEYFQITQDNRESSTGNLDRWAIDCLQLEEGSLSSWMPYNINSGIRSQETMTYDLSNYVNISEGTLLFDYTTKMVHSGLSLGFILFKLGDSIQMQYKDQGFYLTGPGPNAYLPQDIVSSPYTARFAATWIATSGVSLARIDTDTDQVALGPPILFGGQLQNTDLVFNHSGPTTDRGRAYNISNMKLFQRALTLDEMKIYD